MIIELNNGKKIEVESCECESESKYDEKGRIIWYRDSDGTTEEWKYDKKGRIIWHKYRNGTTEEWKYNEKGNTVWFKNTSNVYYIKGKPYIKR